MLLHKAYGEYQAEPQKLHSANSDLYYANAFIL